jgi:hypothetical protein
MAKKKPPSPPQASGPGSALPAKPEKEVLYLEMDERLKRRLARLALLRRRKLTAEGILAVERYVEQEEAKENLGPLDE